MTASAPPRVSIVVPFHNEGDGIDRLYADLCSALDRIPNAGFEIVCVDDGSTDDTLAQLIRLTERDARVVVIELSRNFGKEAALSAGIDAATGHAVIPIDADLQDPPELIATLIAEWRDGADVVLARRTESISDSFMKRTAAQLFYGFQKKLSDITIPDNVGDFRLMNRAAVDALKALPERNRFMKGLFAWVGFRTATVDYARSPRASGRTKFSGWRHWNFALEGITSFSTAPLRLWTYLGGIGALGAVTYASVIILRTLIRGVDVPGYASLLVVVLFVGSIQLIGIGVLGEYIGRIYLETKQRPRYIVRKSYRRAAAGELAHGDDSRALHQFAPPLSTPRRTAGAVASSRAVARSRAISGPVAPAHGSAVSTAIAIAVIIATAFLYNRWQLDGRTFFYADDWPLLSYAEFVPWQFDRFPLLPSAAYNDRPLGVAFLKAVYQLFGLNHRAFELVLLSLHAINCVLLYAIAGRYATRGGALLAALLAAVWFSANIAAGWPAAIFDLLGATLCLSAILLRQLAIRSGYAIRYDIAGAACYLLAIRTKEFALGLVALLFLLSVLVERQSLRAAFRQLTPYLIVFAIYAIRYAQLIATAAPPGDSPYHLDLSLPGAVASLGYYVKALFYAEDGVDAIVVAGLIAALGAGMYAADDRAQRTAVFGLAGYVILLGPTLLLPSHLGSLYLYAPHFFMALVLGALFMRRAIPAAVAVGVGLAILVPPIWIYPREHSINFNFAKGEMSKSQFESAVKLLTPLPAGATVFISGVEPFFNPFWNKPGSSLRTAFKDYDLAVETEKPEAELIAMFCATAGARRFLRFEGKKATDATGEIETSCKRENSDHAPAEHG